MLALNVPRRETLSDQMCRIILSRQLAVKRNVALSSVKIR